MPTVLLVDDDEAIREVLRIYAECNGLTVVGEAVSGRDAVELAARLQPDVIVLDQEMPDMTGLDALPRLRRRVPRAVIIFYTSGIASVKDDALALGATAFVTKAETPKALIRTIVALIQSRPPVAT
jgi:CheY-like chemotaxis protein